MNWAANWVADLGENVEKAILALGDIANFSFSTIWWLLARRPYKGTLLVNFYQIGVLSLPVVALTGVFIGMVLAVQKLRPVPNARDGNSNGRGDQHVSRS